MISRRGPATAILLTGLALTGGAIVWQGSALARGQSLFTCTFAMPVAPDVLTLMSIPSHAKFQVGGTTFGPYNPRPKAADVLAAIPGMGVAQWVNTTVNPRTAHCKGTGTFFNGITALPNTVCVDQIGTVGVEMDFVVSGRSALFHLSSASTPAIVTLSGHPQASPPHVDLVGGVDTLVGGPYAWFAQGFTAEDVLNELLRPSVGGTVTRILQTSPPSVDFWNGTSGTNFPIECDDAYVVRSLADAKYWWP